MPRHRRSDAGAADGEVPCHRRSGSGWGIRGIFHSGAVHTRLARGGGSLGQALHPCNRRAEQQTVDPHQSGILQDFIVCSRNNIVREEHAIERQANWASATGPVETSLHRGLQPPP